LALTDGRQNDTAAHGYVRGRLQFERGGDVYGGSMRRPHRYIVSDEIARRILRRIYGAVTLFASDVVFDEIGVLQPHEFNGEAIFDVAHDAALGLADRDDNADRRPQVR
jgi:hypothetical protein